MLQKCYLFYLFNNRAHEFSFNWSAVYMLLFLKIIIKECVCFTWESTLDFLRRYQLFQRQKKTTRKRDVYGTGGAMLQKETYCWFGLNFNNGVFQDLICALIWTMVEVASWLKLRLFIKTFLSSSSKTVRSWNESEHFDFLKDFSRRNYFSYIFHQLGTFAVNPVITVIFWKTEEECTFIRSFCDLLFNDFNEYWCSKWRRKTAYFTIWHSGVHMQCV